QTSAVEAEVVVTPPAKQSPMKRQLRKGSESTEVLDSKSLDKAVKAIKAAQQRGTEALFEVGEQIVQIRDKGLFTLRRGEDGRPLYKNLHEFPTAELGMSRVPAQ